MWWEDPTSFATTVIATVVIAYVLYRLAKYIFDHM